MFSMDIRPSLTEYAVRPNDILSGMSMLFMFVLNMPAFKGRAVHQIIGKCNVKSLDELLEVLTNADYILVEQYYSKGEGSTRGLEPVGDIILSAAVIGKVIAYKGDGGSIRED